MKQIKEFCLEDETLSHLQNEVRRLVPDLFLFFKKALYEVILINTQYILLVLDLDMQNKLKFQIVDQFRFLRKGSGTSFSTTFCV